MAKPDLKVVPKEQLKLPPPPPSGVDEILALFGPKTFMVPCHHGQKRPVPGFLWTKTTFEETLEPEWREMLHKCNIAIRVGPESNNLIAIDFDDDEHLDEFTKLNPWILETTRSHGARGCQFWLRMVGPYPELMLHGKDGGDPPKDAYEWRGGGVLSTIYGQHPTGNWYERIKNVHPMEAKFPDIVWPDEWEVPAMKTLETEFEAEHGAPFVWSKKRQITRVNHSFFTAKYAAEHDILYDVRSEAFHNYHQETGLWKKTHRALVRQALKKDVKKFIQEEITAKPDDADQFKDAKSMLTHPMIDSMAGSLGDDIAEESTKFNERPRALHFTNCMVEIDPPTFQIRPFSKDYYSRNACPIKYDPDAKCPNFIEKLLKPAMVQEDIDLLQAWFGQAIMGFNLHQVLLLMIGTSNGGKGALVNTIKSIIGNHNIVGLRPQHLEDRFEYSLMVGKTLLYGPDVKATFFNTDGASNIKSLVGGDPLTGEIKGGGTTEGLEGTFNVLTTCNTRLMLKLEGDAAAWQRRILMINFEYPASKDVNRNLVKDFIATEGSGIVNWCIEGLKRCFEAAAAHHPFPQSDEQRAKVSDLINESDSVRQFITTRIQKVKVNGYLSIITSEQLYAAFLEMCEEMGWTATNQIDFCRKASAIMAEIHHAQYDKNLSVKGGSSARGYKGVIFAPQDPY